MEKFEEMYHNSWYTIIGVGGDIEEWKTGYQRMLDEKDIGKISKFETFSGEEYNEYYQLTGTNRYPEDLTFLAFSIEGLDISKLAIFKLIHGDRWFDDVVDNDRRREGFDEDE